MNGHFYVGSIVHLLLFSWKHNILNLLSVKHLKERWYSLLGLWKLSSPCPKYHRLKQWPRLPHVHSHSWGAQRLPCWHLSLLTLSISLPKATVFVFKCKAFRQGRIEWLCQLWLFLKSTGSEKDFIIASFLSFMTWWATSEGTASPAVTNIWHSWR